MNPDGNHRCSSSVYPQAIAFLTVAFSIGLLFFIVGCGGNNSSASAPPPTANPVPTIMSLSPSSATTGATAQTLTINGTNFLSTSTVAYNNLAHAATFVSATQLTISLSASDLATAGKYAVIVTNPSPGGGASNAADFSVGPATTLTINITGLSSGTSGNVTVTGPNSYSQTVTQTTTLSGVAPGTYSATAAIVTSPSVANTVYIPSLTGSPANVTGGGTVSISIAYSGLATAWQPVGPLDIVGTLSGKVQSIAIDDQNPLVMYAGPGDGQGPYSQAGIYKTSDGGTTWTQANAGLTDPSVTDLWLDQSNPNTVLATVFPSPSTTSTPGILRSTDAGAHWSSVGSFGPSFALLQVGGSLYAATWQGIAESSDDGASWTLIEPTSSAVRSLSAAGSVIYAGLNDGTVLVQNKPSAPWVTTIPTSSTSVPASSVAANPANPNNAFVVEWNNYAYPDLYVTTNGGASWTPDTNANFSVQGVRFDPLSGALYIAGEFGIYQSSDGGATWSGVSNAFGDDRLIVPDAGGIAGNLLAGGDQGLFLLPNGTTTWESLTKSITSSIVTGFDVSGSTILAAAQDFSPLGSFDSGSTWPGAAAGEVVGEDGTALFNPGNPAYAYEFGVGAFQYSSDGGHSFQPVSTIPSSAFTLASGTGDLIAVDRSNPSTVYVAAIGGVYKSMDSGVTFVLESWPVTPAVMVVVDPSDSKTIFVGTGAINQSGELLVTKDGGSTWTTSTLDFGTANACSFGSPISLAVNPTNPNIVLLGMSVNDPYAGDCLLRSTDGGADFSLANNGTGLRPVVGEFNGAVPHIVFDPSGSGIVAADTPSGLYLSTDLGDNWTNVRANAIPYIFSGVKWSGGYLYASTNGEGVLRMSFPF